ncbi:MAG: hypothetical protein CMG35_11380 [Candidatus Marinimicrobia bacterium]|nr:hypothetical protein [Candidatus Neomarinimicrobiota bacterium]|tara:strand:- start:36 stop:1949 length:1914 start_codon:yes stop_codon:yes gene_type:complete
MTRARDVADKNLAVISAGNSGQILTSDGNNWSAQDAGITELSEDTTPALGGDLSMGSHSIADGVLGIKNTGTQSELRMYCEVNNAHYVALKAPAHANYSGNPTFTLPPNTGSSGQLLQTDGAGAMSWGDAAAGGNTFQATANGSIADGKPVILENTGTVAQVALTGTSLASVEQNNGAFRPDRTSNPFSYGQSFYNPVENMVFVVYRDEQTAYPTVVVGEVSNTTANGITWGTPVILDTVNSYWVAGGCQESNGRMAAFWQDNQLVGKCIGFIRSGTLSVTLGSSVQTYDSTAVQYNTCCYDSVNDAIVIGWRQFPSNGGATYTPMMRYCNVLANTSINFLTSAHQINGQQTYANRVAYSPDHQRVMMVFSNNIGSDWKYSTVSYSGGTLYTGANGTINTGNCGTGTIAYDTTADKFVTFYNDGTASRGQANVLTLTAGGTNAAPSDSVSVGPVQNMLAAGQEPNFGNTTNNAVYWPAQDKTVVVFSHVQNAAKASFVTATVSGTTITFTSPEVLTNSNYTQGADISCVYDDNADTVVITFWAYRTPSTRYYVRTNLLTEISITNLTASNFLGIASGSVTNGQTATIQLTGNVDDAQTGMTVNDTMYVQDNGTLANSAGSVSVVAGRALSATHLKIA